MKMVKRISSPGHTQTNGNAEKLNEYIGSGQDHLMAFGLQDIVDLNVSNVQLAASDPKPQNGGGPSFRTDAEISGINKNLRERELQPWQPGPETDVDLTFDSSSVGAWDQFAANEKLYNVVSDYDESIYTTTIDRSNPLYRQREAEAKRIAREIERSEPVNSHVAEERRMNARPDAGIDEEDKYSGVRRDVTPLSKAQPSAYVPPSKRPITSQPTVSGAPFDPAIISSQIARPTNSSASNSDAPRLPQPKPQETNDASRALAAAQPTSNATTTAPTITVAGAAPQTFNPKSAASPATKLGTEGVERKLLDSFKQFSNTEKLKYQEHQRAQAERSRKGARHEKAVKLNDLKKFAESFKLYSRVPDDLVPILAKTKEKQEEIVSKAEQQARDKELKGTSNSPVPDAVQSRSTAGTPDSKYSQANPAGARPDALNDTSLKQRLPQTFRGNTQPAPSPRAPPTPNARMPSNQPQAGRPGIPNINTSGSVQLSSSQIAPNASVPAKDSGLMSPTTAAATRLNVKAMEFKPNPGASAFTPGGVKSSPVASKRPSIAGPSTAPITFRTDLKKPSERGSFVTAFQPTKRARDRLAQEGKAKEFVPNGGIPQAFKTPPVWDPANADLDSSYVDGFEKALAATISPMHTPANGGLPYQGQLPIPMPHAAPHMQSAQGTPRFYPVQPHGMPNHHMEEQRMHYGSSNSSVQPSPRMGNPAMAYAGQMHSQLPNFPGGMPPYGMNPAMQMRPLPGGPQYQGPAMGGQMMVQQPSNGPYMNGPMGQQMQMYGSPNPANVQPQFQPGMSSPYGGSHAQPMRHQGSQQGPMPQSMYMAPQGGPMMMPQHPGMRGNFPQQGQFQQGGYGMQHRAMSNGGYSNHPTPRQPHAVPQGPGPNGPPMHGNGAGDEGK